MFVQQPTSSNQVILLVYDFMMFQSYIFDSDKKMLFYGKGPFEKHLLSHSLSTKYNSFDKFVLSDDLDIAL